MPPEQIFARLVWQPRYNLVVEYGPIVELSERGDDMVLTTMLGVVHYIRHRDSAAIVTALRAAADLVEEHGRVG